jgi:radical SAM superfamily enzyme YgiQ (UPF0313 family)
MRGYEVVLTADRSFMSDYHFLPFLRGLRFASTSILNSSIFFRFVAPSVPTKSGGVALLAPYHTRRTEAALLDDGFDQDQVVVVVPERVNNFVGSNTKVVSITVRDPLSKFHHYSLLNPLGRESYSSLSFKNLIKRLQRKDRRYKIVVEGPGAWQLTDPRDRLNFSVDHVIVGEYTTSAVPSIFRKLMEEKGFPHVLYAPSTDLCEIPTIRGGVNEGLVEVARGCNRGCRFCNVPRTRCRPLKDVVIEAEVNVCHGQHNITFRSDDILNYGANGIRVNRDAVLRLYRSVQELQGVERVGQCYLSLASAVSNPTLVREITEIIGAGSKEYPYTTALSGIESGSPRLIEKYMPGKVRPFKPSEWDEVVEQGFAILNDNHWVPIGMLILGFPREKEEDIRDTIALIEKLKHYRSILLPFVFEARSALNREESFNVKNLEAYHLELIQAVFNHNIYWGKRLLKQNLGKTPLTRWLLPLFSPLISWGVKRAWRKLFEEITTSKSLLD